MPDAVPLVRLQVLLRARRLLPVPPLGILRLRHRLPGLPRSIPGVGEHLLPRQAIAIREFLKLFLVGSFFASPFASSAKLLSRVAQESGEYFSARRTQVGKSIDAALSV